MDNTEKTSENPKGGVIHYLLFHSYAVFLFAVVLGALFDLFINFKIFTDSIYQSIGLGMIILGTMLIYWAQNTSSPYKERIIKEKTRSSFEFGPYRYIRNPTYLGLFIMTIGLGLILGSVFSVVFTFVVFFITKIFFIKKEEQLLEGKYGQVYRDYKKKVRNWI
jgi:protein-S-isoprenylcysteine O-methyltransferase Ste14